MRQRCASLCMVMIALAHACASLHAHAHEAPLSRHNEYDNHFRHAAKLFMPPALQERGWELLKAQAAVESNFNPQAVSPQKRQGAIASH